MVTSPYRLLLFILADVEFSLLAANVLRQNIENLFSKQA